MKKRVFYTELAYVVGVIILAFGTALMERADFGVSMVVAPAYLLHLKISEFLPFFSFGMAEYTLQAILLIAMMLILRRVHPRYFFSLVTAVLYGFLLDLGIFIVSFFPYDTILIRVISYILGMLLNGTLIGMFTKIFENIWSFEDGFRFGNADGGAK